VLFDENAWQSAYSGRTRALIPGVTREPFRVRSGKMGNRSAEPPPSSVHRRYPNLPFVLGQREAAKGTVGPVFVEVLEALANDLSRLLDATRSVPCATGEIP